MRLIWSLFLISPQVKKRVTRWPHVARIALGVCGNAPDLLSNDLFYVETARRAWGRNIALKPMRHRPTVGQGSLI